MAYLDQYFPRIAALPLRERYSQPEILSNQFLLGEEGALRMFYAPVDHTNASARVIILFPLTSN